FHVTGVQTCALPILEAVVAVAQEGGTDGDLWSHQRPQGRAHAARAVVQGTGADRLDDGDSRPVRPRPPSGGIGPGGGTGRFRPRLRPAPRRPPPPRVG